MPSYLCHGFRWKRRSIIVYVVVQNLDDAAPHWIIKEGSARNIVQSFYSIFDFLPDCKFPPTNSAATLPRSNSLPRTIDQQSTTSSIREIEDDDASGSLSARSTKQSRQYDIQGEQDTPYGQRESSNSGRKRSKSEVTRGKGLPSSTRPSGNSAAQLPAPTIDLDDPVLAQHWSPVKLLEEFDANNADEVSRPYAYVADYVTRIDSSVSIVEEIQRYEKRVRKSRNPSVTGPSSDDMLCGKRDTAKLGDKAGWFEQLRDQLQVGEAIRWYVVTNSDEERTWPADEGEIAFLEARDPATHHEQYAMQQMIFEEGDRNAERKMLLMSGREQGGGADGASERRLEVRTKSAQK